MRTINCISYLMFPIEKIIKEMLMSALFDGFPILVEFRKLLALPCKLGGMGIIDPTENANNEYNNSREPKSQLTNSIKHQLHSSSLQFKNNTNDYPKRFILLLT